METDSMSPLFSVILPDENENHGACDQVDGRRPANAVPYIVYTNSIEDLRRLPSESDSGRFFYFIDEQNSKK